MDFLADTWTPLLIIIRAFNFLFGLISALKIFISSHVCQTHTHTHTHTAKHTEHAPTGNVLHSCESFVQSFSEKSPRCGVPANGTDKHCVIMYEEASDQVTFRTARVFAFTVRSRRVKYPTFSWMRLRWIRQFYASMLIFSDERPQ